MSWCHVKLFNAPRYYAKVLFPGQLNLVRFCGLILTDLIEVRAILAWADRLILAINNLRSQTLTFHLTVEFWWKKAMDTECNDDGLPNSYVLAMPPRSPTTGCTLSPLPFLSSLPHQLIQHFRRLRSSSISSKLFQASPLSFKPRSVTADGGKCNLSDIFIDNI